MGQHDPNNKHRPSYQDGGVGQPGEMDDENDGNQSNEGYCLIAPVRNTSTYTRRPMDFPFSMLPEHFPQVKEYYDRIIANNTDEIDCILVEEVSLLPALHGDIQAMVEFLSPIVDGQILPKTMGAITTMTGWMVTAFDYLVDGESDDVYTMLYITELPQQAKLAYSGFRPTSNFTLSRH